jgi:hypothetical protein
MVDRLALGQVYVPVLLFSSARIVPLMLNSHLLIHNEWYIMLAVGSVVKQHT